MGKEQAEFNKQVLEFMRIVGEFMKASRGRETELSELVETYAESANKLIENLSDLDRLVQPVISLVKHIEKLELEKQEMKGEIEEVKKRLEEMELQSKPIGRDMEGIPNLFRIGKG